MKATIIALCLLISFQTIGNDRLSQEGYVDILSNEDGDVSVNTLFRYKSSIFISANDNNVGIGAGYLFDYGQIVAGYHLNADIYAQALIRLDKTNIQYELTARMDTKNDKTTELEFGLSYYLTDYTAITGRYHLNDSNFYLGIRRWF